MMMDIFDCFSDTVGLARARFLAACDQAGIRISAFSGHVTGSENDSKPAYADVALFGSPAASTVLVLAPSEGGRSSFLAAGIMTACIRQHLYTRLPRNLALLMVHAVNPKGPLWEGGDMPTRPIPAPPPQWENDILARAEARFLLEREQMNATSGFSRQELADRPLTDLIAPAWDNKVIEAIASEKLADRQTVFVLEIGEGAIPAGKVELYSQDAPFWQGLTENAPAPTDGTHVGLYDILSRHEMNAVVTGATARFGCGGDTPLPEKAPPFLLDTASHNWQQVVWNKASDVITHAISRATGPDEAQSN